MKPIVLEVRYDLQSDIALLDGVSQLGLMDLSLVWAERNAKLAAEVLDLEPFEVDTWPCLIHPQA